MSDKPKRNVYHVTSSSDNEWKVKKQGASQLTSNRNAVSGIRLSAPLRPE